MFSGLRRHPLHPAFSEDMLDLLPYKSRAQSNVRYYFIDFGISTRVTGPGPYLVTGQNGRDPSAPELSDDVPYDPFKVDIFVLGNFLRKRVYKVG